VFRRVRRPTHDELLTSQLESAKEQRGQGDLQKLLTGSETWVVP
jgi:2-oxoglutarate/2-oxoacid ferredoxin oxidoreductase subunit beta